MSGNGWPRALEAWREALGPGAVLAEDAAAAWFPPGTTAYRPDVPAVLRPADEYQVVALVRVAARYGTPLHPVSRGRSWGYGDAQPSVPGCAVVDLSRMDRILDLDPELGLVTLEPGVTQGQLQAELDARGANLLVPVTGAGPEGSLLGNALERGFGETPITDHFLGIRDVRAVLPDGSLHRSALAALGAAELARAHRWGIGPCLDGLFSQGALGIVTRASLLLAPRFERYATGSFTVPEGVALEDVLAAVRALQQQVGAHLSPVALSNPLRRLAALAPYPADRVPAGAAMPADLLAELAAAYRVPPWTGEVVVHGPDEVVAAVRSVVQRLLGPAVEDLAFQSDRQVEEAARHLARLPDVLRAGPLGLDVTPYGRPRSNLGLAYWRAGAAPSGPALDPARDGCGVHIYAPLVPLHPGRVRGLVDEVASTCRAAGFDPIVRVLVPSGHLAQVLLYLLFDRRDPAAAERAAACFRRLFEVGLRHGAVPGRLGAEHMALVGAAEGPLAACIRAAVDPQGIVDPGRYR